MTAIITEHDKDCAARTNRFADCECDIPRYAPSSPEKTRIAELESLLAEARALLSATRGMEQWSDDGERFFVECRDAFLAKTKVGL